MGSLQYAYGQLQRYQPYERPPPNPAPPAWPTDIYHQPQPTAHFQHHQPTPLALCPAVALTSTSAFAPTPTSTSSYNALDYPYVPTGKRQMTLLAPDRSAPLFTVLYPSSWATRSKVTVLRGGGGPGAPEVGGARLHSFTTGKVDAFLAGRGSFRFRKRFVSLTGLASAPHVARMVWAVEDGALVLSEDGAGGGGGCVARFVTRDGAGLGEATTRLEGRLEVRRVGLTGEQFEEVVVTLVAEMERRRRSNEEWEIVGEVMGEM
ncbi:hypothetical protein MFIFM68171_04751 [Madurella fahalii]|uniref:Uncharacterized protein n=1 Tax=Madurella fahalii TaxID=1157608 RepID=A0ABQ0G9Y7_9PEZI